MSSEVEAEAPVRATARDHYIPVRKIDILNALLDAQPQGSDRDAFREVCRLLGALYHYRYFDQLEQLRDAYFYFNPEVQVPSSVDDAQLERAYHELLAGFSEVMEAANFILVQPAEIERAHREREVLRVELEAPMEKFREVRVYRRGRHKETFHLPKWWGLRQRQLDAMVYDDVVILVAMKSEAELASLEKPRRRKGSAPRLRPRCVMIKYFRNIASADLNALFPDVRVVMSTFDKLMLGVPALIGGVPLLLKLAPTVAVLFLVTGFYLGLVADVDDDHMKSAIAALTGLVAVGAFIMRQFVKWQRQTLKYQKEVTDNVYFRNVNNNSGIFDYIIGAAEEQDCKEAFLAYHFLALAAEPPTSEQLDRQIEGWLKERFGVEVDFEAEDAIAKLQQLGLAQRLEGGRLSVVPPRAALAQLDTVWDNFFSYPAQASVPSPRPVTVAAG